MCAVIGWKGNLPKGLLSQLLVEAESRGKDSTGIAFRADNELVIYRHAIPASRFIKKDEKCVGAARRADIGIAHTRRASKGMPINNENAHPFIFEKYVYAHNGKVDNWQEIKTSLILQYESLANDPSTSDADKELYSKQTNYLRKATTDSMVLGKAIKDRDFSNTKGCMGLVWIKKDQVYCFRSAKELVAVTILWNAKTPELVVDPAQETKTNILTIVASTQKIIEVALSKTKDIEYDMSPANLDENTVYRIEKTGLVSEGVIPVNQENHADEFTSAEILSTQMD